MLKVGLAFSCHKMLKAIERLETVPRPYEEFLLSTVTVTSLSSVCSALRYTYALYLTPYLLLYILTDLITYTYPTRQPTRDTATEPGSGAHLAARVAVHGTGLCCHATPHTRAGLALVVVCHARAVPWRPRARGPEA